MGEAATPHRNRKFFIENWSYLQGAYTLDKKQKSKKYMVKIVKKPILTCNLKIKLVHSAECVRDCKLQLGRWTYFTFNLQVRIFHRDFIKKFQNLLFRSKLAELCTQFLNFLFLMGNFHQMLLILNFSTKLSNFLQNLQEFSSKFQKFILDLKHFC